MNASSARKPFENDDPSRAWALVSINLLVLPGLGSILGGKRVGWFQAALALIGFGLTAVGLVSFLLAWFQTVHSPTPGTPAPDALAWELGGDIYACLAGLLLFAVAWGWALLTSLNLLCEARKADREKRDHR